MTTALKTTTIYQGDTARLDFIVLASTGAAQDLTGCTLRWAMASPDEIDTPLLAKTPIVRPPLPWAS